MKMGITKEQSEKGAAQLEKASGQSSSSNVEEEVRRLRIEKASEIIKKRKSLANKTRNPVRAVATKAVSREPNVLQMANNAPNVRK